MAPRRACAALLALGCLARASALLDFFGGAIDVSYACLVLTALDDGGPDTLRTALGDPRCAVVKLAAGCAALRCAA